MQNAWNNSFLNVLYVFFMYQNTYKTVSPSTQVAPLHMLTEGLNLYQAALSSHVLKFNFLDRIHLGKYSSSGITDLLRITFVTPRCEFVSSAYLLKSLASFFFSPTNPSQILCVFQENWKDSFSVSFRKTRGKTDNLLIHKWRNWPLHTVSNSWTFIVII